MGLKEQVASALQLGPDARRRIRHRLGEFRSKQPRRDAMAGVVLGVESVPDSLAAGVLAGVNPVAGLYGYLYGMMGGVFFTGTAMLAIQGTSAMAIIVAEQNIGTGDGAKTQLITLSIVTGLVMLIAARLKLGTLLRFISESVMTGFVAAVGINIILGQLPNFTGYKSDAGNRVTRLIDTILHVGDFTLGTILIGVLTLVLIVVLRRTALGEVGLVVAIAIASGLVAVLSPTNFSKVQLVSDIATIPNTLPWPGLPSIGDMPKYILPAMALTFVGLVQGAAVATAYPSGLSSVDPDDDFVGQGMGNIAAGVFGGIPVGGSMSATALAVSAGGRSRATYLVAGAVMGAVVLFLGPIVSTVPMPALAALLIYVGASSVKVRKLRHQLQVGQSQAAGMLSTFAMTIILPLQWAVLLGVGLTLLLYVVKQSNELIVRQLHFEDDGKIKEEWPPKTLGRDEVIVLQHYGGLFFATADSFVSQLPEIDDDTHNSVIILRTRGIDQVGNKVAEVFHEYLAKLHAADSKMVIVTNNDRFHQALDLSGVLRSMGEDNLCRSGSYLFEATRQAHKEAQQWVRDNQHTAQS